jgi:hypothetical protein
VSGCVFRGYAPGHDSEHCQDCIADAEAGWLALARIGHVVATGHALEVASGYCLEWHGKRCEKPGWRCGTCVIDAAVWGLKGGER